MHYWIIAFLCAHQARSLLGQNAQPPTSAWELEVESERFSNFDLKLSQLVAGREASNVALSPISVKLVLAMLYEGARGNTSIELQRVLGIKQGGRSIDSERLRVILQSLQASHEGYEIAVGTKLFVDKDTYPYPRFEKDIKDKYNGTIEKINFKNTNEAVKKINSWAKTVTNGHIKHLLNEIDTSANTALLLVNALYFKGLWENQFPLNQTKDGTFYVDGVTPKNVSFMNAIHNLKFALSGELNASVIRLPYKGGKFAMYILLPLNRTGLPSLIQSLTAQKMRATVEEMQNYPVQIKLPKFNFEFSASLAPVLEELGLKEMFSPNANLSGIAESPKELVVTNVIQKAALEINEHGSTAAVATAVNLETRFGEHNAEFEATHPFLLYIEDETTKTVVFVAKVVNPNNQEESVVSATSVPPPTAAPTTRTPAPLAASPTLGVPGENAIHLKTSSSWSEGSEEEDYDDRRSQNAPVTSQEMLDALEVLKQGVKQCQVTPPRNACHDEMVSETSSKNHADGNQPFDKNMFSFFDIELMNALENSTNQENLVVSSASIKSALSLVYEASVGATREELASALRLDQDAVRAKRQLRAYQQALRMPSASTEVHSACRILVKKEGQRVKHDFIQLLSQYGSDLYSADYSDPAGVAKDVNDWVSGVTKGKIPKLVSKESISDQTSLLIVNAIYFNGLWRTPFEKPTIQGCFYTKASGCKMTEMMKVKGIFRRTIHKELNAHILELPYEDSRYSMVILLPNEQQGLQQVSRNLGHVPLFPVIEKMAYSEVAVFLPKFTIEYTVPLLDPLKNLNLRTMFTPQVDLSGMFKEFKVNGTQITNVVHKAKIEVTEEGTIAAAGTAVYAEALSSSSAVPFKVDHPFLFFIIDSQAGFLFQGKFADPSSPLTAKRQVNNNYGQSERIQTNEQGYKRVVELKRPQPNRPTYLYETSEE